MITMPEESREGPVTHHVTRQGTVIEPDRNYNPLKVIHFPLRQEEPRPTELLLDSRTQTTINGHPATIEVFEKPGQKSLSVITIHKSPLSFGERTFNVGQEITSASQVPNLRADNRPAPVAEYVTTGNRLIEGAVEVISPESDPPGALMVRKVNPRWEDGHPMEDYSSIFAEEGLAGIIICDGITSTWHKFPEVKHALAKNYVNPPLEIAQLATARLIEALREYKQGQRPFTQENLRETVNQVHEKVQVVARSLLKNYAQRDDTPIEATAGTTLAAAVYLTGVGLAFIRVGDPVVKFGPEVALGVSEKKTSRPVHLGSSQIVEGARTQYAAYPQVTPDIVVIPEEKLQGIYEDVPILLGSDAATNAVAALEPEETAGRYHDRETREAIVRKAQEAAQKSDDDFSLILTSVRQLKRLAVQAKPQAPAPARKPGTQPLAE